MEYVVIVETLLVLGLGAWLWWVYDKLSEAKAAMVRLRAEWEAKRAKIRKELEEKYKDATFDELVDAVDRGWTNFHD